MGDTIAWTSRWAGIRRAHLKDMRLTSLRRKLGWQKAGSTLRSSRAVPHPSTNRALRRLTSEVERDPVHSTRYGRQREHCFFKNTFVCYKVSVTHPSVPRDRWNTARRAAPSLE